MVLQNEFVNEDDELSGLSQASEDSEEEEDEASSEEEDDDDDDDDDDDESTGEVEKEDFQDEPGVEESPLVAGDEEDLEYGYREEQEEDDGESVKERDYRLLAIICCIICCCILIAVLGLVLGLVVFKDDSGDSPSTAGDNVSPTLPPTLDVSTSAPRPTFAPIPARTLAPIDETPSPTAQPTTLVTGEPTPQPTPFPTPAPTSSAAPTESLPEEQTITVTGDTSVMDGIFVNEVYGFDQELYVLNGDLVTPNNHNSRTVLEFKMSDIRPLAFTAKIPKTATLIMHHVPAVFERNPSRIQVSRMLDNPINLEGVTGFAYSGFLASEDILKGVTINVTTTDEEVSWDITDLVFGPGTKDEEDLMLILENVGEFQVREEGDTFHSREYDNGKQAPRIHFVYDKSGTVSPTTSPAPSVSSSPTGTPSASPSFAPTSNITIDINETGSLTEDDTEDFFFDNSTIGDIDIDLNETGTDL